MKTKHIVIAIGIVCTLFIFGWISVIGVGLIVWSVDSPASDTQATAAETIRQNDAAASSLVGSWVKAAAVNSGNRSSSSGGWSSGSNVYYTFYEDGTYQYRYESFASIDVSGASSLSTDNEEDSGQFQVGNGEITLKSSKGSSDTLVYRVVDEKYIQIGNAYFARR
jgi:hypothetical protein